MMLDNITLFTVIFYGSLLFPILAVFNLIQYPSDRKEKFILSYLGPIFVISVFLLIAFRPVGEFGFTDTEMYIKWFNESKDHNTLLTKDIGFGLLIFISSKILTVRLFFIICTLLSFATLFWISKIVAGKYWFLFFLGSMVSLYFWNHQVFTIRQGLASLFFLAGLFQKRLLVTLLLFIVAISFHKSFLLPFICYLIVIAFNKTHYYLLLWLISIPISFFFGNGIGNLIADYSPTDIGYYYFPKASDSITFTDFRWDVVLYSGIFVIFPYYYKFRDEKYLKIFNLYLLTNIFTILMIWSTGGYIHRFAYLSWFLSPVIVYYPLFVGENLFSFKKYFKIIIFFYGLLLFYIGIKLYKQDFKFISNPTDITTID